MVYERKSKAKLTPLVTIASFIAIKWSFRLFIVSMMVALLLQWLVGYGMFEYECRVNEGFWWTGKPVYADSVAVDKLGISGEGVGCSSDCLTNLLGTNLNEPKRMAFVEYFVHSPNPDYLSTELGWYRYWVSLPGNLECAEYEHSISAQKFLALQLYYSKRRGLTLIPASNFCIAAKKIKTPESRYLYTISAISWQRNTFGISTISSEFKDRQSNEVISRFQRTTYVGPWLHDVLDHLLAFAGGLSHLHKDCKLPEERYKPALFSQKPFSSLNPLRNL